METNLSGKFYVVTGATSGIGLAVAEALARQGAGVIGVGRSAERCAATERRLNALAARTPARVLRANLALQSEVRALARAVREALAEQGRDHLDGLVNNAGTFTYWQALTAEGFETQWAVNHLAPFLLTRELLPLLRAAPEARVLVVSSDAHYYGRMHWDDLQLLRRYDGLTAYGQSKLANVLFALEFNRRWRGAAVRAFAVDPGLVKTDIGLKDPSALARWVWRLRRAAGDAPDVPAAGIARLLSDAAAPETGAVYWKNGRPKAPGKHGLDPAAATRLWSISERMCGLSEQEASYAA